VLDHRDEVLTMLRDRSIQTNECGRAPAIALGLAAVTAAMGRPEALVDAGASAGLNLLYDCYRLDLGEAGVWGDPRSPVVCGCEVRGGLPSSLRFIDVPVRIGLDRAPVDVTDPVAARWLLACTWPDTGRLERLRAALAIAGASPPDVRAGDLVTGIGPLLDGIDGDGLVCVVTSWVLSWLAVDQREAFLEALVAAGSRRPIAWLSLDVAGTVPGIDAENSPTSTLTGAPCLIGLTTFGPAGVESQRPLAHVHPHGVAVQWIGATD
jgi:hypothetical protein